MVKAISWTEVLGKPMREFVQDRINEGKSSREISKLVYELALKGSGEGEEVTISGQTITKKNLRKRVSSTVWVYYHECRGDIRHEILINQTDADRLTDKIMRGVLAKPKEGLSNPAEQEKTVKVSRAGVTELYEENAKLRKDRDNWHESASLWCCYGLIATIVIVAHYLFGLI